MRNVVLLSALGAFTDYALGSSLNKYSSKYDMIEFTNVGFSGTYQPVASLKDVTKDSCTCEVGDRVSFSGTNAPISDYVSVHFRGPLSLSQFAFYTSDDFVIDSNSSSSWSRQAYYDSSSQTGENVTFLTKAGTDSPCLGKALTYSDDTGIASASDATLLGSDNLIHSDDEYVIFSNISCPSSKASNGCGVYRSGIPAYYGFYGTTKMFLFEFEMPTETETNSTSFSYYDLPAIWLLNDHIPRTSQYPSNTNCSCWASGCGEFDIFEVMNATERNHFYSSFHTFQGISNIQDGIQAHGYIQRNTTNTMRGGVIFDSNGEVVTFLSDSTTFDDELSASTINDILEEFSSKEIYSTKLASVVAASTTSSSSKSGGAAFLAKPSGLWYYCFTAFAAVSQIFFI
ncbi:hypothetical protein KAFR_0G00360 [Kazachstania africana CBS 2517]|uniref:glucan endo-1,3-beta-D-glucosidase n=1 Tax=Kazachstania africana (strain ATCC 22294 / BCRC 22015 / CBS 2517 / CECT 1963 / NBRC 1671 / NRRL Y-8276) TaxID=1071382 RepID=H2AXG9_KAZAF|nr:hypothetical protein KAFR_0G00360 [Kazachstania africana CBS 2517]CCF59069.1 hypothetical protein KAFR_0G00360 [Kazachstania africana CBS 2517]